MLFALIHCGTILNAHRALTDGAAQRVNMPDAQNQVAPPLGGVSGAVAGRRSGRRDGHAGRGGFPHEVNLHMGQAVGLVD